MSNPPKAPQRISRLTQPPTSTSSRWQAIVTRDASIDNFVYGVLTTQIYCRPACPARRARRANVRFYDTPAQAQNAGFRPCKRCHPQIPDAAAALRNPHTAMIENVCQAIRADLSAGTKPRIQDLAAQAGLTPSHFLRVFKKYVGVTPGQYVAGFGNPALSSSSSSSTTGPDTGVETEPETMGLNVQCGGLGGVHDDADEWRPDQLDLDDSQGFVDRAALGLSDVDGFAATPEEEKEMVEASWNDFDVLLAGELEQSSLIYVDPQLLSTMYI